MPTLTLARSCFNLRAHSPPPPAPSPVPAVTPLMPSPRHTRQSIRRKPVPSLVLTPTTPSSSSLPLSRPPALTLDPTNAKSVHRARSQGVLRPAANIVTTHGIAFPTGAPSLTNNAPEPHRHQIDHDRHPRLPLTPPSTASSFPRASRHGTPRSGVPTRPGTPPPTPAAVRRRRDSSPPPPVPALPAGFARGAARHRPARLRTMTMVADSSSPSSSRQPLGRLITRISSSVLRPGEREGDEPYWECSIDDEDQAALDSPPDSPNLPVTPTTGSRNSAPTIVSPRPRGGYFLPSPTANNAEASFAYAFESKYGSSS